MAIVRIKRLFGINSLGAVRSGEVTFTGYDMHGHPLVQKTLTATLGNPDTQDSADHFVAVGGWSVKSVQATLADDTVCEWDASV